MANIVERKSSKKETEKRKGANFVLPISQHLSNETTFLCPFLTINLSYHSLVSFPLNE